MANDRVDCEDAVILAFSLQLQSSLMLSKVISVCLALYDVPEMDEEDCERRRMECLDEMSTLEKQFNDLKDQ